MVGLAVNIGGEVTLLGEHSVPFRPQVQEDVEEVGGLQVGGDGDAEVVLAEDLLDLLPLRLQGPALEIGDAQAIISVEPQVEVGIFSFS